MTREEISNEYFKWMCGLVYDELDSEYASFKKLLLRLHNTEFTYLIPKDANRVEDGLDLRRRYALLTGDRRLPDIIMDILDGPCSVLEMMIALAIRCEETIMDDPDYGDRTSQWFWSMISSLGLNGMTDANFNRFETDEKLATFLNRRYSANGKGGLFTIRRCHVDLRSVEIWAQLCWYLNSIS